jgi:hypothetical protein
MVHFTTHQELPHQFVHRYLLGVITGWCSAAVESQPGSQHPMPCASGTSCATFALSNPVLAVSRSLLGAVELLGGGLVATGAENNGAMLSRTGT